jgi:mannose/cellobiose epimerase-like protein (N-acyl-D-glucosamine 2-epimerase family)
LAGWPITEALYALVCAYTLTKEEKWLIWLNKVHSYGYTYFADKDGGGEWFGYLNRDGERLHDVKGVSAGHPPVLSVVQFRRDLLSYPTN